MFFDNNVFHHRQLSSIQNSLHENDSSKSNEASSLEKENIQPRIEVNKQLKLLISFESFLGINRLYLFGLNNIFLKLSNIYSLLFVITTFYFIVIDVDTKGTSHIIFKNSGILEYITIGIFTVFWQKDILQNYFSNLKVFDKILEFEDKNKNLMLTDFFVTAICFIINDIIEFYLAYNYIYHSYYETLRAIIIILVIIIHDVETIFICILICMMLKRVMLLKAHVSKEFDQYRYNEDKLEILAQRVYFNISNLHKMYDLLHSCSEQLSRIISYPVRETFNIFITIIIRI